jgi:hypothetical protein
VLDSCLEIAAGELCDYVENYLLRATQLAAKTVPALNLFEARVCARNSRDDPIVLTAVILKRDAE